MVKEVGMGPTVPHRTLVVANRTAATMELKAEIGRRARQRPTRFTLLVPNIASRKHDDWTLERAAALLREDAGGRVEALAGGEDPFDAIRQAVDTGRFDDVVISTLPQRRSAWLRRDLPRRVARLGLPVTVITQAQRHIRAEDNALGGLDDTRDIRLPPYA
jgi:hypothetical protein